MSLKKVESLSCEDFAPFIPKEEEIIGIATQMLDDEVNAIQERHSSMVELENGAIVENFDLLKLSLNLKNTLPDERAFKRFNKDKTQIRLGDKIFAPELEEQLLGKTVGSDNLYNFKFNGSDISIQVKIETAERMLLPNREEAFKLETESNEQYSCYKDMSFDEFKKNQLDIYLDSFASDYFIQHGFSKLTKKLVEDSGIVATQEELDRDWDELEKTISIATKEEGMSRLEYFQMMFGDQIKSLEDGEAKAKKYMKDYTRLNLYSYKVCEDEGFLPSKDTYEVQIKEYAEETGETVETISNQLPFEDYSRGKIQEYVSSKLLKKFAECREAAMQK